MDVRFAPTRREIIAGSLATLGLTASGLPVSRAAAAPGVHKLSIGALDLTVLSDGILNVATRLLNRDMEQPQIEAALGGALSAPGQVQYGVNVVLVRQGRESILIDAGGGANLEPTVGKLADRLEAAGVDPKSITKVVITHGHPDHIWGLVDEFDELRFPNADHIMPAAELDFWRNVELSALPERTQGVASGAKRVIGEIGARLRTAPAETDIVPGMAYIATPGHTPGHCAVRLTSGSAGVIVTADTVFHPIVSFAHPDWQPLADMDGARAAASRRRLLDMAVADKLQLLSYHIAFPGLGHVERAGSAYRWLN